ncbi:MAG TPA: hypothetical protein VNK04_22450 [Gemmataceae bacterium]|jgi:hypothetical protein|nr:hypothetical protein [Gemmataceae bacterium]
MRALLRTALAAVLLAVAGCGGGTADVAGKVTFRGKPVVFGTVVVIGPDGVPKSGAIQPDGTYRVRGVKTGIAKVTVSSPPPPGLVPASKKKVGRDEADERTPADAGNPVSPEVARGWFPVPEKYADPERSGLTAEVKPGQPVDIDLK